MTEQVDNKPRRFVWTSKGAPRESQTLSIWALVETLGATVLVNALAWYFDCYIWLLSSVLIGPLLLLRSPTSMATAVRWHEKDFFDLRNYEQWSIPRLVTFIVIVALITGLIIILPLIYLAEFMLTGQSGWWLVLSLIGYVMIAGVLAVPVAVAVVVAGAVAMTRARDEAVGMVVAWAVAVGVVVAGAVAVGVVVDGAVAVVVAVVVVAKTGPGVVTKAVAMAVVAMVILFRTLLMRLSATCWHCIPGFKQLPRNWWENCFVVDWTVAPTLMPVDRDCSEMTIPNTWKKLKINIGDNYPLFTPVIGIIWFAPAYLYRLNIKSTFWFYWPLVFLLRPISPNKINTPEIQLVDSISNPFILFFNCLGIVWLAFNIFTQVDLPPKWEAVPPYIQYVLMSDWAQLEYWDYAHIALAVLTLMILALSCQARVYYKRGYDFHQTHKWALPVMMVMSRVRTLTVIISILLALGSIFINMINEIAIIEWLPEWLAPRLQESFVALRHFYHIQPLPIP